MKFSTIASFLLAGTSNASWWPNLQNSIRDNAVQPQRVIDAFNSNPELSNIIKEFQQDSHKLTKVWDMVKLYGQMLRSYPRSPGQVRKSVPLNRNFNLTIMSMLKAVDGQPNRGMTIPQLTKMLSYQMLHNQDFENNIYIVCNNLYNDNSQIIDQVFKLQSFSPLEKSAVNYWDELKADNIMSTNNLNRVFLNMKYNAKPFYDSVMKNVAKRELKRRLWLV